MAWNDVFAGLAGAAGGLADGMQMIQQQRQRSIQQQLQQRQQQMQEEQEQRQALMQAYESRPEGYEFGSVEEAKPYVNIGLGVFKGPDGRLFKPKSLQTQAAEIQMKNSQTQFDQGQEKWNALKQLASPEGTQMPADQRRGLGLLAGTDDWQTPQEALQTNPNYRASLADNATQREVAQMGLEGRKYDADLSLRLGESKLKWEQAKEAQGVSQEVRQKALEAALKQMQYEKEPAKILRLANQFVPYLQQQEASQLTAPTGGKFVGIRPR